MPRVNNCSVSSFTLLFTLLTVCLLLQACGGSGTSTGSSSGSSNGKYGYGDGPPPRDIDVSNLPNAVPKVEPIRKAGNKSPYTVFGKTYRVLPSSLGYRERGIASWYGNKFHGRKTSNGEIYSMYEMTAAHKSLPIPSYVKVTNLDNGRTVIVRVNDRGPFHGDRIIDLSYAAAKKLDYSNKGTANVEVVAIDPRAHQANSRQSDLVQKNSLPTSSVPKSPAPKNLAEPSPVSKQAKAGIEPEGATTSALSQSQRTQPQHNLPGNTYLQVGAFNSALAAESLSKRVEGLSSYPVVVRHQKEPNTLFKVLIGPVKNNLKLLDLRTLLRQAENLSSFVVYE